MLVVRVIGVPIILLLCVLPLNGGGRPEASKTSNPVEIRKFSTEPLLRETDELTVLNNTKLELILHCVGGQPSEWNYNFEGAFTKLYSPSNFSANWPSKRSEYTFWSEDKFRLSLGLTPRPEFYTMLDLSYEEGLSRPEKFICRAVGNHSNNVVLKLDPNVTAGEVHITKERDESQTPAVLSPPNADFCPFRLFVTQEPTGHYVRCGDWNQSSNGVVNVFQACNTSASCSNTYRSHRAPLSCVTWVTGTKFSWSHETERNWYRLDRSAVAGVSTCVSLNNLRRPKEEIISAVEYFMIKNDLHCSVLEVSMNDLIWLEPEIESGRVYYTVEALSTTCYVSKYGLAEYRILRAVFNGSDFDLKPRFINESDDGRAWTKHLHLQFDTTGPGEYLIECKALVWNTTEMANQTRTVQVRHVSPPHLESIFENVTWAEGQLNRRLACNVTGDPTPKITWNHRMAPGVHVEGDELVIDRVTAEWNHNLPVSCTGSNRFGHSARKVFKIHVEVTQASPFSSMIIILITLGLLLLASSATVVFLYFRSVRLGRVVRVLTDKEVNEFHDGRPDGLKTSTVIGYLPPSEPEDEVITIDIDALPYSTNFEVAKEDLFVDLNKELGSGQFGVVFRGRIHSTADVDSVELAVKTVRPNVPIEYFKALLSELKILAYIGSHENIANLIGAYTAEIKNRVLYVGVELCKCSLLQHLRESLPKSALNGYVEPRGHIVEESNGHMYHNYNDQSPSDLVRWAAEIATGMEFLTQKRIVHGDLAARNVLLSFDLHAKICDFGLARQLVDYTYIKTHRSDTKLPMKWLALESLTKLHFTTKSDVWAFGVTCWEIFSLGAVPFPPVIWKWNEFVEHLEGGNRPQRPEYANQIIYEKMWQCWLEKPKDRPTFSELAEFFKDEHHSRDSDNDNDNANPLSKKMVDETNV